MSNSKEFEITKKEIQQLIAEAEQFFIKRNLFKLLLFKCFNRLPFN